MTGPSPGPARGKNLAGTVVGNYEVLAFIGAGGMGEVYRARDARLGREVALKVLPAELSADGDRRERFEREARAASALSHPNIVTVYEVGSAESVSYIAMELLPGRTLREICRGGALPPRRMLDLAIQIAQGLSRAHAGGIVHRDLKPDNIMVSPEGLAKILDFGLAKLARTPVEPGLGAEGRTLSITQPGSLLGTYGYMSPEQVNGETVDFRSDQFSFGAILYEMATGKRPFHRARPVDTLSAILHEEPEPVAAISPAVPAPVRWIIDRCLCKDPKERYASTEDLARELATVREHLSEASFSGVGRPPVRARRWMPKVAAALAAGLVVLGVGVLADRLLHAPPASLRFTQLTFRRGGIWSARFAPPDGQTIVYGAAWEGKPLELFTTRVGSSESRSLDLGRADILSISPSGEMAVLLGQSFGLLLRPPHVDLVVRDPRLLFGTLAQVPLAGGAPRELLEGVFWADWDPQGRSLAVVRDAGRTERLEYPIGTVLYENEPWLNRPRVSPDGKTVAFQDTKEIYVVTPPEKPRSLDKFAEELAWSPSGKEIWYSHFDGAVTQIRAVTLSGQDRPVATLSANFVLHDIAPDGRVLVSRASQTSEIYAVLAGENRLRNLSWLDQSDVVALSEDGKTLLFEEPGAHSRIYVRGTDGSPAKQVGEGDASDLSPDGKWVLIGPENPDDPSQACILVPTGAGERRVLPRTEPGLCGTFFDRGRHLADMGTAKGQGRRLWVRDIDGTKARAVTPEGTFRGLISPDGRFASALGPGRRYRIYPTEGGEPSEMKGLLPGEEPIQWSSDGRSLFVRGADEVVTMDAPLARVYRLDPWSGRRELFREIPSLDPSAGGGVGRVRISADEKTLVFTHYRFPSELFLIEGLR